MTLLLSTLGVNEIVLPIMLLLVIASAVRFFFNNRLLKKHLDEVTKEREGPGIIHPIFYVVPAYPGFTSLLLHCICKGINS